MSHLQALSTVRLPRGGPVSCTSYNGCDPDVAPDAYRSWSRSPKPSPATPRRPRRQLAQRGRRRYPACRAADGRDPVVLLSRTTNRSQRYHPSTAQRGWDNVVPVQCLVGETVGDRVLYEPPSNSQIFSLSAMWNQRAGTGVTYLMTTLDTRAAGIGLERADLIKLDVEVAELQVIWGGTDFLRRSRPTLLLEINNRTRRKRLFGYSIDDLLSELRALGYEAFYALRPRGLALFQKEAQLLDSDRDMLATANAALHCLPSDPC